MNKTMRPHSLKSAPTESHLSSVNRQHHFLKLDSGPIGLHQFAKEPSLPEQMCEMIQKQITNKKNLISKQLLFIGLSHGMQNLSSLTRHRTQVPCSGSMESYTLECQETFRTYSQMCYVDDWVPLPQLSKLLGFLCCFSVCLFSFCCWFWCPISRAPDCRTDCTVLHGMAPITSQKSH